MSRSMILSENFGINTLSIVPDSHPQVMLAILDLHLNASGVCMPDGIAQRLYANAIHFITNNWIEGLGRPLYLDAEFGTRFHRRTGQYFFAEIANGLAKINRTQSG
jgi:hypothetical protein